MALTAPTLDGHLDRVGRLPGGPGFRAATLAFQGSRGIHGVPLLPGRTTAWARALRVVMHQLGLGVRPPPPPGDVDPVTGDHVVQEPDRTVMAVWPRPCVHAPSVELRHGSRRDRSQKIEGRSQTSRNPWDARRLMGAFSSFRSPLDFPRPARPHTVVHLCVGTRGRESCLHRGLRDTPGRSWEAHRLRPGLNPFAEMPPATSRTFYSDSARCCQSLDKIDESFCRGSKLATCHCRVGSVLRMVDEVSDIYRQRGGVLECCVAHPRLCLAEAL